MIMEAREPLGTTRLFSDYQDRLLQHPETTPAGTNAMSDYMRDLWEAHRCELPAGLRTAPPAKYRAQAPPGPDGLRNHPLFSKCFRHETQSQRRLPPRLPLVAPPPPPIQIEGRDRGRTGRKPSIWDRFAETPERLSGPEPAGTPAINYHRYPEEVALMQRLGAGA